MDTTVKTCYTCNEAKPLTDFHRDGERLKPWCKPCRATARKNHSNGRIGKEAELRARLRARYGITLEEREEMRVAQDGKCAICLVAVDNLYVDHCHETGKVRGLDRKSVV